MNIMDHIVCCLVILGASVMVAHSCPKHCACQNLSESLGTLCPSKGLLFVPPDIDRSTVELRLGGNFILRITQQDFANMSDLVDLTLSRNTISYIQPFSFGDLQMLRSIHLDNNRLTNIGPNDLHGLFNLQHLILNNNQLEKIHEKAFEDPVLSLEDLDLSYNNLMSLPWDSVRLMVNLHQLSADHNMLEFIPEGTFTNLERLARLDLTSNRLQKLPPDPIFARAQDPVILATPQAPELSLSLGGNPLRCNCEMLWLRRLEREDELETCASPSSLKGRYFWNVEEEEFVCQPPLITQHTRRIVILEGQKACLNCEAVGDPSPSIQWISPQDQLLLNSSRTKVYKNGTLCIFITTSNDYGTFTCLVANVAGESTAPVEVAIVQLPHLGNGTGLQTQLKSQLSDITGSTRTSKGTLKGQSERAVFISEVKTVSAVVTWSVSMAAPKVKMYQLQYNCSDDEVLIYRMIPASSKAFMLTNLVPGTRYDVCVLAAWDDTATTLTVTNMVGCTHFFTQEDYSQCQFLPNQLLRGTMILVVGGIIVATLLVFLVILMVRYKAVDAEFLAGKLGGISDMYSQTHNMSPPLPQSHPHFKAKRILQDDVVKFKCGSLQSSLTPSSSSSSSSMAEGSFSPNSTLASILRSAPVQQRPNLDRLLGTTTSLEMRVAKENDPGPSGAALPLKAHPDRVALLRRTLDSSLSRLLMLPLDSKPKRSQSFDMGDTTDTCASLPSNKPRRISTIWTKRSLSVNGTLLQSDEEDTSGKKGVLDNSDWVFESTV